MAVEALNPTAVMPVSEKECEPIAQSESPEIPVPSGVEPWGAQEYLTNEEALRLLETRNSGIRPLYTKHAYRTVKRIFDICATGAAIAILAVPSAILCAVICVKSPGASPIYSQWRIGRVNKDGSFHAFKMLKFRSMCPNADAMLKDLQEKNEATGPMFKIKEGIGRYGSRLRRSGACGCVGSSHPVRIHYESCGALCGKSPLGAAVAFQGGTV